MLWNKKQKFRLQKEGNKVQKNRQKESDVRKIKEGEKREGRWGSYTKDRNREGGNSRMWDKEKIEEEGRIIYIYRIRPGTEKS